MRYEQPVKWPNQVFQVFNLWGRRGLGKWVETNNILCRNSDEQTLCILYHIVIKGNFLFAAWETAVSWSGPSAMELWYLPGSKNQQHLRTQISDQNATNTSRPVCKPGRLCPSPPTSSSSAVPALIVRNMTSWRMSLRVPLSLTANVKRNKSWAQPLLV